MAIGEASKPHPEPLRVLIVEDDDRDAALLVATLKRAGYALEYEIVSTPEKFQQRLLQSKPNLVLSDYNLRNWNALKAQRIIGESGKDIPLIVVTGALSDRAAAECLEHGVADYILKDRMARLPAAIARALEARVVRRRAGLEELKVLALEDNDADFELMIETLSKAGYRMDAHRVLTPSQFERDTHESQWDVILADFTLGDWNAAEALAILRNSSTQIPLIIVTGVLGDEAAATCMKEGAFDYVLKDRMARLPAAVSRALEMSKAAEDRKLAEAEKTRLITAIEQCAESIYVTDGSGAIQYVNPAFTRVTGYSREEALGQNPRFLKSGQHGGDFYRKLWETILSGKVWRGEFVNRHKDGSLYYEETSVTPVQDDRGRITHFIATNQDITEGKKLEDQFRQAQKMEAIGRLAGGVAHDFNNLLTIITGYSELLLTRLESASPLRLHAQEIKQAGDRAAALTRQLLAFGRRQVLQPQVLDLNAVVANMDKMLRRLIGEDIDLVTALGTGLRHVKADPGQIEQVIMNLAVNARDAMPEGGRLTLETANVELDEAYARNHVTVTPGPYVMLAASDTGCGMDAETQAHIFEPFFTTKEQGKGTGLGLATVYGIVKQSGGNIWVYSESGRGTTLKIYLPWVEEVVEAVAPEPARAAVPGGTETVLLVEDEAAVRTLVCGVLESNGYKVLEGNGPTQALLILDRYEKPIHLLLTDVVMPQMSGQELAAKLAPRHPKTKVLFMSGYTDNAIVHHGVLDAGTAFLQKPFTPDALARKVREVLDSAKA